MERNLPTSTFSLASGDSLSPQDGQDSAQSPSVKSNPSVRKSSRQGSGLLPSPRVSDSNQHSQSKINRAEAGTMDWGKCQLREIVAQSSSPTSSPSTAPDSEEQLCLPGASPASLSVTPGSDEARKMTVRSGLKCLESSMRQGPLGSLERMLAASSAWNSTRCLLTWNWKATPRGRSILELSASTPRTAGCESGLLLKTPSTIEAESENRKSKGISGTSGTLSQEMASGYIGNRIPTLLKTPSSVETEGGVMEIRPGCDGHYKLRDQIAMLPTPHGMCWTDKDGKNAAGGGDLEMTIRYGKYDKSCRVGMLPTPTNQDSRIGPENIGGRQHRAERGSVAMADLVQFKPDGTSRGLKLQPAFVEWMMGYPLGFTHVESVASKPSATPSSRKSLTKSSRESQK